ncbi:MAG: ABC transporter permease subunit [Gammaproteobacteria bacterium]|nr:ABC transporter permease subunit [Gammaproteobacteria bacterium]
MMMMTIAAKELRALFLSPMAWAILAVVQGIVAYFFLIFLENFLQLQPHLATLPDAPGISSIVVAPLFATVSVVLLLIVPLLTMRLVSEERRNKTLTLLMSAPVSISEIVIGKFTGIMIFLLLLLALISLMPLSLLFGSSLDVGMFLTGLLALTLLLASFTAVGLYVSTLTTQPTVAAVGTFGILLLLWILDLAGTTGDTPTLLAYLSIMTHYQNLLQGIFSSSDVIYYLLFILVFLVLSIRRLDAERLPH